MNWNRLLFSARTMTDMMGQDILMMNNNMMIQMMDEPETRDKMTELMIEHTDQFQEIRSQELDDEQFNLQVMELLKQRIEKMKELMDGPAHIK